MPTIARGNPRLLGGRLLLVRSWPVKTAGEFWPLAVCALGEASFEIPAYGLAHRRITVC